MPLLLTSFGPVRVAALPAPQQHPAGGPYRLENNGDCLLDVADLVIIDAPGTGYSSIQGADAAAKFYGIDQDAEAFDRFIRRFLSKYERWRSPKYLFGHSYGTMRNAVLGRKPLGDGVSLNGMISGQPVAEQRRLPGLRGRERRCRQRVLFGAAELRGDRLVPPQGSRCARTA